MSMTDHEPSGADQGEEEDPLEYLWLEHLAVTSKMTTMSMTLPGQCAGTLCVEPPSGYAYFQPYAVALYVHDTVSKERVNIRVTGVSIDAVPQLGFFDPYPTVASKQYIHSDQWSPEAPWRKSPKGKDKAYAVAWGVFTCHAFAKPLVVSLFNPEPAGTAVDVKIDVFGEPYTDLNKYCCPSDW